MTTILFDVAAVSAKIFVLGCLAWAQLCLLRRAPASSRSRMCSMALIAVVLLGAGEMIAPHWTVRAPASVLIAAASGAGTLSAVRGTSPVWWLGGLWAAGAAWMLLRALAGRLTLAMVRRKAMPVGESDRKAVGVEVRIAPVQTPVLCGLRRPAILLPDSSRTWTNQQRDMVLTHELTHFQQGDVWANLLAQAVRVVFWFHPVVWLLASRLSREQELTCDEAVIAAGHSRQDYAAFLLETARDLRSPEVFACAMAGSGGRSLKERFARLLDETPRAAFRRRVAIATATLAVSAAAMIVVRPVWSQSEPDSANYGTVYRVGGDVTSPQVLTKFDPQYTEAARRFKISGPVHLKLVITPEGKPDQIEVTGGIGYGLDESAIEAISRWTFQPATKEGQPVAAWANVLVNFRLL